MKHFKLLLMILTLLLCGRVDAQELSISTNFLDYVDLGTMNVDAAWGFARHWSAHLGLRYNPFTFPGREGVADQMQARQRTVSFGGRYWPWHIHSGWWVSGKAQYQECGRVVGQGERNFVLPNDFLLGLVYVF